MCVEVVLDILCWIVVCEDFYLVFIFVRLWVVHWVVVIAWRKKLIETPAFTITNFQVIGEAFAGSALVLIRMVKWNSVKVEISWEVAVWVDSKESCPWLQVWWFSCVFEDSKLIGRRLSCLDCVVAVCFMNWQKWWWGLIFTCITTSDQLPQSILQDNSRTMLSMNPLVRNKLALCLWVACWMYFESPVFFVLFWFSVVHRIWHWTDRSRIMRHVYCCSINQLNFEFIPNFRCTFKVNFRYLQLFVCWGGGPGGKALGRGWGTESPHLKK